MNSNSNSNLRNFIVNSNYNSNQPNYSTKRGGENFARRVINSGNIKTRGDLRWLARHMYKFSGNSNWFHGGLSVITNRFNHLNKLRNKWRTGVRMVRSAKNFRKLQKREIHGSIRF